MTGSSGMLEPWLRGTLADVPPVQRAVLHALQQTREDLRRWCGDLSDEQLSARPAGLPSVAFHLRHIAGSLGRLLVYAEGGALSPEQFNALSTEGAGGAARDLLFRELGAALDSAELHVRAFKEKDLGQERFVGSKRIPVTLGALLVHIAEHTMRHVGQAITTAKLIQAQRISR